MFRGAANAWGFVDSNGIRGILRARVTWPKPEDLEVLATPPNHIQAGEGGSCSRGCEVMHGPKPPHSTSPTQLQGRQIGSSLQTWCWGGPKIQLLKIHEVFTGIRILKGSSEQLPCSRLLNEDRGQYNVATHK